MATERFGTRGRWHVQQINTTISPGKSQKAPAAAGDPSASILNQQFHIVYRDAVGNIWDVWYGPNDAWSEQQINTSGRAAVGNANGSIYNNQWHVIYRDSAGTLWDSWYYIPTGAWSVQRINTTDQAGMSKAPAAAGDAFASVFNQQWHVVFRDQKGNIWDSWYENGWNEQQINTGLAAGKVAVGEPHASVFGPQWHVLYRDADGTIWDSWYGGNSWNLQQINTSGKPGTKQGITGAPAAAGDATGTVVGTQWHVVYQDASGTVWDSWYDPQTGWHYQQINSTDKTNGVTMGPAGIGKPVVSVYGSQLHIVYRDNRGILWDSWFA